MALPAILRRAAQKQGCPCLWLGLCGLAAASAGAEPRRNESLIPVVRGACERLVLQGRNATSECLAVATHSAYPIGSCCTKFRSSFTFALTNTGRIAFSGTEHPRKGTIGTFSVQEVRIWRTATANATAMRARGSCRYSNPLARVRPIRIECVASTSRGPFEAAFAAQPEDRR